MAQQAAVIDMNTTTNGSNGNDVAGAGGSNDANTATPDNTPRNMSSTTTSSGRKTTQEPLFGPNIGLVSSGPSWAVTHEKKVVTDDLTPDVVKGWVEKSKQTSQPTTTLQALVNLKRPTLRLSPLSVEEPGSPSLSDPDDPLPSQIHGLEFEYDCDAPKCGIYVHVLLPKDHPDALATVSPSGYSKILVFEAIAEGGFARLLKLEEGAMLELGRFEQGGKAKPSSSTSGGPIQAEASMSADAVSTSSDRPLVGASSPSPGITEVLASSANETGDHSTTANNNNNGNNNNNNNNNHSRARKRFSAFTFRRKVSAHGRSVSGPALAVVDMGQAEQNTEDQDPTPASTGGTSGSSTSTSAGRTARAESRGRTKKESDEAQGVRVLIRLAALDEMGTELISPNEQVTYLHIVRFGTKEKGVEEGAVEDIRPWVVKVAKREATIGPHTFQLHEIYGLTASSSTHTAAPTAPLPNQEHSYPPTSSISDAPVITPSGIPAGGGDEPQSECLLCLSAPREVVLLPCRHLVACRECALNMVEFGAGGQITQATEDTTTSGAGDAAAGAGAEGGASGVGAEGGANGTNTAARRRRKAKGWYCPVCRQPYMSLLRITTHPPAPERSGTGDEQKNEVEGLQSSSGGVREATDGVQGLDIADQPLGSNEDANDASRGIGIGRMFMMGRRGTNNAPADENV
jgi:hypothetical protein